MAREAEKSGRETGKSKAETSTSTPSSTSTGSRSGSGASARSGSGEEGSSASESGKSGETGLTEFRSERHREMQETLAKRADDGADVTAIVREFTALWIPNHVVEVELLVPALEDADVDRDKMTAVAIRKDMLNLLLADLIQSAADEGARAKLEALSDLLDAVITASQQEAEAMSEAVEESTLSALGPQMRTRYERLKKRFADRDERTGEAMNLLAPRSLSVSSSRRRNRRESDMARQSSMPDRDEQGRFMPEDDRGYSRGGGGYRGGQERDEGGRYASESRRSRSQYEDEDDDRYGGGRRYMGRDRDEDEGRYSSGGRQSMGRDDEGGRYGGGRRFMGRDRDEDEGRYSSRSSGEGRGHGGWFGDPEGHSEASRRGWRSGQHGESGWFGDPEGHSEAARRRWEEEGYRSQRRDDDGRFSSRSRDDDNGRFSRSRPRDDDDDRRSGWYESRRSGGGSRYEDDDDRSGRGSSGRRFMGRDRDEDEGGRYSSRSSGEGRGHGGWFGDPEGHSEAARRAWEHRR